MAAAQLFAILDRKPTIEDMMNLKFTTRVINESMRLYPQPPVLIRRALEEVTLDGYKIEPGTDFFISVWNLHRNPRLWENPDKFDPDRFPLDERMPNEVTQNYAYLPFGGGQRKCVGDQFALFESIVTLAMVCRRFDFELDASKEARPAGGVVLAARVRPSAATALCTYEPPHPRCGTPHRHDAPGEPAALHTYPKRRRPTPVSYTHLTLPTILLV